MAGTMPMLADASVTQWIDRLKAGDPDAAQKLWERYFRRLVGLARKKLRASPRRAADEEDVALSAFDSFCRGAGQDRFPRLHDRLDLWQLLVLLTARKAVDLAQHERRQKRGGGRIDPEGKYEIKRGQRPGKYRVEIRSTRTLPRKVVNPTVPPSSSTKRYR